MTTDVSPETVNSQADEITERLARGEKAWAQTSLARRRQLLARFMQLTGINAAEWVQAAARIKQLPPESPLIGEEWISGPWAVLSYATALARTLERLDRGADVLAGFPTRTTATGQLAIKVLPHTVYDRLLLNGFRAEVWMAPGITEARVRATAGLGERNTKQTRGAALVLGAGNIFSIAPLDTIYQLYAENRVAVLKLNPVTDPLKPVFEKIFAPFIDLGVVEILAGGVEIGSALAYHPRISAVHITGSEQTHDAIVWGSGEQGQTAKAARARKLTKPITSELGGVAPVIVIPGQWSQADLRFQARHVATQRLHNAGSNCIAAQIVIVSSDWDQKAAFLAELRSALAGAYERPAWYPGSEGRVRDARERHPSAAEAVGGTPARTLLPGLDLPTPRRARLRPSTSRRSSAWPSCPGRGRNTWPPRWRRRTTGCAARSGPTSSSTPTPGGPSARRSSAASRRCATGRSGSTPGPASATSPRTRPGEPSPATPWTTSRAGSAWCTTHCCSTTPNAPSSRDRSAPHRDRC